MGVLAPGKVPERQKHSTFVCLSQRNVEKGKTRQIFFFSFLVYFHLFLRVNEVEMTRAGFKSGRQGEAFVGPYLLKKPLLKKALLKILHALAISQSARDQYSNPNILDLPLSTLRLI